MGAVPHHFVSLQLLVLRLHTFTLVSCLAVYFGLLNFCAPFNRFCCAMVYICYVFAKWLHADVCLSFYNCLVLCLCVRTTFLFTKEPEQVQLWELQTHTWHTAAIIKKPIDDSDPSLWEMEREIGWKKGEGRREAVDEMFLLCFTASDTDPTVNKSFTLACILFRYGLLFISFLLYVFLPSICIALSCLQSHYRVWCTGQVMAAKQLLSWGSSGHIFFSILGLSGLSYGTLTTMSQQKASCTNRRHSCVFWACSIQLDQRNICRKCESFVSVAMSFSCGLLVDKAHSSLSSLVLIDRETLPVEYSAHC